MNLDLGDLKKQKTQLKETGNRGGGEFLENFVKMPEGKGTVLLRLMPPAKSGLFGKDKNPFYLHTRVHRLNDRNIHCRRENGADGKLVGDCPVCKYLRWLWDESTKAGTEEQNRMRTLYRQIKAIDRYYYNVVVRNVIDEATGKVGDVGPKILAVGKTLHQLILTGIVGDEEMDIEGYGDVTDLKNGRDFKIVKTIKKGSEGTYPEYSQSKFVDKTSPIADSDATEQYLAGLHDLSSLRIVKAYEEIDHELKVHIGVSKSEKNSDFDPSAYKAATFSETATASAAKVSAPKAAAKSEPEPSLDEEAVSESSDDSPRPMADEEFMAELNGMGG
jgi:hypothetical protein